MVTDQLDSERTWIGTKTNEETLSRPVLVRYIVKSSSHSRVRKQQGADKSVEVLKTRWYRDKRNRVFLEIVHHTSIFFTLIFDMWPRDRLQTIVVNTAYGWVMIYGWVFPGLPKVNRAEPIDYRWDNRRLWLSAHNCQVPTPTSQNLEFEQQIRIFGAD
jgi:hypothetical protein